MAETPTHGRVNCTGANSQSSEVAPSDPRDIGWQPPNPPPYLRPIKFDLNSQYLPAELETYLLSKCDDFTNRPATVPGDWNSMFNCFANIRYIPEAGEDRESIDRFRDFCNKATHEDYGNLIRGRVHTFTVDSKDISMVLVHRTKEFIQGTPAGRQYPFLLYMENMLMHAEDRIAEEYAAMFEWMQSNDKKPPIEHGAMQLTLPSFCHRQNPSNHPNRPFCQVSNSLYLGNFTDYMQSQSKSPAHLNNSNNLGDQPAPAAPSTNVPVAWHPSHLVHPTQLGLPTWAEGGRSSDAVFYELLNPTPLQYLPAQPYRDGFQILREAEQFLGQYREQQRHRRESYYDHPNTFYPDIAHQHTAQHVAIQRQAAEEFQIAVYTGDEDLLLTGCPKNATAEEKAWWRAQEWEKYKR